MSNTTNRDYLFVPFTLNDINVVELLIEFRYKYDDNLFLENGSIMDVTGTKAINQEVVATYASLDSTIEKCKFSEQQINMIKMVEQGYTQEEISNEFKIGNNVSKLMKTIYKAIVKENERQWRKVHYTRTLGLKTVGCSKCNEQLPATDEFFNYDSTNSRYKSSCKKCR